MLLALAIVAFLAKDALLRYLGPAQAVTRTAPQGKSGATPGEPAAPSSAATPMDRARSLQETMQKESEKRDGGQ